MISLEFDKAQKEIKKFLTEPKLLQEKINKKYFSNQPDDLHLPTPYPDWFRYWKTFFQGFYTYPERLENFIKVLSLKEFTPEVDFYPYIADIEPTTKCNLNCIMCQTADWDNHGRCKDMTLQDLKKILTLNPFFQEIKLHGYGEPFLNKHYTDMVEFLSSKHIWVRTSTNGSFLHLNDNFKRIIDAEIGEIQCSLDGATEDVFKKIRRGGDFNLIKVNLKKLNDYANKKEKLYTRMWVLVQKNNRHQLKDFVYLAEKLHFRRLTFSIYLNDFGQDNWRKKNETIYPDDFSEKEIDILNNLKIKTGIDITVWKQSERFIQNISPCYWPFQRPYITAEGLMIPCCMIGNPNIVSFGSVYSFQNTWNNNYYKKFRQKHLTGEIPDICKLCYK